MLNDEKATKWKRKTENINNLSTKGVTFKKTESLYKCIFLYSLAECFLDLFLITIGEEFRKKLILNNNNNNKSFI